MERYLPFPIEVKQQVRREQGNQCAWCGAMGCLQVHHIVPSSQATQLGLSEDQITSRENAVGLCEGKNKCHETFDTLALSYNTYFDQVMMEHGKEYPIKPKTVRRNPPQIQVRDIVRFVHR